MAIVLPFFLPVPRAAAGVGLRAARSATRDAGRPRGAPTSPRPPGRIGGCCPRLAPWGEVLYPGTMALVMGLAGACWAFGVAGAPQERTRPRRVLRRLVGDRRLGIARARRGPLCVALQVPAGVLVAARAVEARPRRRARRWRCLPGFAVATPARPGPPPGPGRRRPRRPRPWPICSCAPLFLVEAKPIAAAYRSLANLAGRRRRGVSVLLPADGLLASLRVHARTRRRTGVRSSTATATTSRRISAQMVIPMQLVSQP